MWHKVLQSWREILGWLMIALFTFFSGRAIEELSTSEVPKANISFLITLTLLVLAWLWLNKKKDYGK